MSRAAPSPERRSGIAQLFVFELERQRYALAVSAVQRVTWMVRVTSLPAAPPVVAGVISVHGRLVPVYDVRRRFGLPAREAAPDQRLVLAQTASRPVAMVVDEVVGVHEQPLEEIEAAEELLPGLPHLSGVAKLPDGLILIHDLDDFLSGEEEAALAAALEQGGMAEDHAS